LIFKIGKQIKKREVVKDVFSEFFGCSTLGSDCVFIPLQRVL